MKSPAKPEPEARAAMGSPGVSHAEEAEMPGHDNERASEPDSLSDSLPDSLPDLSVGDAEVASSGVNGPSGMAEPDAEAPSVARPKRATNKKSKSRSRSGIEPNNVRKLRQEAMMSKAELARRAGVSPLTIDRVEAGCPCRMDTKRKILEALGLKPSARTEVWPDIDAQS
jgi:DNA-binding XRE family transcriptional regulator